MLGASSILFFLTAQVRSLSFNLEVERGQRVGTRGVQYRKLIVLCRYNVDGITDESQTGGPGTLYVLSFIAMHR